MMQSSLAEKLSSRVITNEYAEIMCPLCGETKLRYTKTKIIHHTLDEVLQTNSIEINLDAYAGSVNIIGISKESCTGDCSSIGIQYECFSCHGLDHYWLAMSEDPEGFGPTLQWISIKIF